MIEMTENKTESIAQSKIETKLNKYLRAKEIVKEMNEENKILLDELEELFQHIGQEKIIVKLESGEKIELSSKYNIREKLNKDTLAEEMGVSKSEIKTPFDFCMFTEQGKLTPRMITDNTERITDTKLKITKKRGRRKKER